MGIVKNLLTNVVLNDGSEYRIELNKPAQIHVHVNKFKIRMTVDEFVQFAETVEAANDELRSKKGL